MTLNDTLGPAYPYNPADSYYGETNFMGPTPTVNSIPAGAVQYTGATALEDLLNMEGYAVFPNPVVDRMMVNTPLGNAKQLTLMTIAGQQVMRQEMNSTSAILDLQTLPAGMYILRVEELDSQSAYQTKIVKR